MLDGAFNRGRLAGAPLRFAFVVLLRGLVVARSVVVVGSTGSIGTQALAQMVRAAGRFVVRALSAGQQARELAAQAVAFRPDVVGLAGAEGMSADDVRGGFLLHLAGAKETAARDGGLELTGVGFVEVDGAGLDNYTPELIVGEDAARACAALPDIDVVLNGVTGSRGLRPTLAAIEAGSTVALANKESLVAGGRLVMEAAAPGQIVPVDSEHSAIAQALRSGARSEVERLIITASGGPFRGWSAEQLEAVTPEQALAHPTWDMGRVVTTNSATLVNKALEVIEAHLLFDVALDRIVPVVHPQSVVHSMVEFVDGSTIAQASPPDMGLPIALGLNWPDRLPGACAPVDWTQAHTWEFFPLDHDAFPAVELAKKAQETSPTHMAVYNAANEEAVDAFHDGVIGFRKIVEVVAHVVEAYDADANAAEYGRSVEGVLAAEAWARDAARKLWA